MENRNQSPPKPKPVLTIKLPTGHREYWTGWAFPDSENPCPVTVLVKLDESDKISLDVYRLEKDELEQQFVTRMKADNVIAEALRAMAIDRCGFDSKDWQRVGETDLQFKTRRDRQNHPCNS